ncbi:MAG: hypothetical protein ABIP46_00550 [Polaromonas sp.]
MASVVQAPAARLDARRYQLTLRGQACVQVVETRRQTVGSLSRYMRDVLLMCGSGVWFEQLSQFLPPRSLDESLRSLLQLGLIEVVEQREAPSNVTAPKAVAPALSV